VKRVEDFYVSLRNSVCEHLSQCLEGFLLISFLFEKYDCIIKVKV
jgi:hypothetical protein